MAPTGREVTRSGAGRRTTRVTRQEIARRALELMRTGGLPAVTMRAVAERLSIQAPSLYEHVAGKHELLELVAREALVDLDFPTTAFDTVRTVDEWVDVVVEGSLAVRDFYLRHPGLARLMQSTLDRDRDTVEGARGDLVHAQVAALGRLGVPAEVARQLFEAAAFWSLAAVAAEPEDGVPDDADRESRFRAGLTMLAEGLRHALQGALDETTAEPTAPA